MTSAAGNPGAEAFPSGRRRGGNGTGAGTIRQVYTQKRTVKIKGEEVTREASEEEPAYLIEQDDAEVLKGQSELRKAS